MKARTDSNQATIVAALRRAGATVQILAAVGRGCPDLLVGHKGCNYLLEVKDIRGRLTSDQLSWHGSWYGSVAVVYSVEDALAAIGESDD